MTSMTTTPQHPHSWAVRPDWDKFVEDAIERFKARGGKIKQCKYKACTPKEEQGERIGRKRVLPPMEPYQKQVYYRLIKEGMNKQEAIHQALLKGRTHKYD